MWWWHSVPREDEHPRISSIGFEPWRPRYNFNLHDVSVQDLEGQLHVEQHLET